jgi:hypothetical protein
MEKVDWTYVNETLEMGQGEQRARFVNEMSRAEKVEFVKALVEEYIEAGLDKADLLQALPEAEPYIVDLPTSLRRR